MQRQSCHGPRKLKAIEGGRSTAGKWLDRGQGLLALRNPDPSELNRYIWAED